MDNSKLTGAMPDRLEDLLKKSKQSHVLRKAADQKLMASSFSVQKNPKAVTPRPEPKQKAAAPADDETRSITHEIDYSQRGAARDLVKQRYEEREKLRSHMLRNLENNVGSPLSPSHLSRSIGHASHRSKSISIAARALALDTDGCPKCEGCHTPLRE